MVQRHPFLAAGDIVRYAQPMLSDNLFGGTPAGAIGEVLDEESSYSGQIVVQFAEGRFSPEIRFLQRVTGSLHWARFWRACRARQRNRMGATAGDHRLLDGMAEMAHDVWVNWTQALLEDGEPISLQRRTRWEVLNKPYAELSEEQKESDREIARRYLEFISRFFGRLSYLRYAYTEFTDRYDALGIPYPDPNTICQGDCEGTGYVPLSIDSLGFTGEEITAMGFDFNPGYLRLAEEEPPEKLEVYRNLWLAAEEKSPADDGWHFVECPDCHGTGVRAASTPKSGLQDGYLGRILHEASLITRGLLREDFDSDEAYLDVWIQISEKLDSLVSQAESIVSQVVESGKFGGEPGNEIFWDVEDRDVADSRYISFDIQYPGETGDESDIFEIRISDHSTVVPQLASGIAINLVYDYETNVVAMIDNQGFQESWMSGPYTISMITELRSALSTLEG